MEPTSSTQDGRCQESGAAWDTLPLTKTLSDEKKKQVKSNLQMKVYRGILRHGRWPDCDKAALLRAYTRWEQIRYHEILKLFIKELQNEGLAPAYEWSSAHIEAELVRLGLEQKQCKPSKARRRLVHVPARLHGGKQAETPRVHNYLLYNEQQRWLSDVEMPTEMSSSNMLFKQLSWHQHDNTEILLDPSPKDIPPFSTYLLSPLLSPVGETSASEPISPVVNKQCSAQ